MLKVTLVYSPNCGACKALKPAYEQLVRQFSNRVNFQQTTTGNVYAFPTTIFEKNGIEITRVVGNNPNKIQEEIEKHAESPIQLPTHQILRPIFNHHKTKESYRTLKNY